MLLHDLLVMLHVRVRVYIHREVKIAALKAKKAEKIQREAIRAKKAARKAEVLKGHLENDGASNGVGGGKRRLSRSRSKSPYPLTSLSGANNVKEKSMTHKHSVSFDKIVTVENPPLTAAPVTHGESTESLLNDEPEGEGTSSDEDEEEEETDTSDEVSDDVPQKGDDGNISERRGSGRSSELETSELEEEEDLDLTPSFLLDPERATRGQRRWLDEICRGEDPVMVKGFRK